MLLVDVGNTVVFRRDALPRNLRAEVAKVDAGVVRKITWNQRIGVEVADHPGLLWFDADMLAVNGEVKS